MFLIKYTLTYLLTQIILLVRVRVRVCVCVYLGSRFSWDITTVNEGILQTLEISDNLFNPQLQHFPHQYENTNKKILHKKSLSVTFNKICWQIYIWISRQHFFY